MRTSHAKKITSEKFIRLKYSAFDAHRIRRPNVCNCRLFDVFEIAMRFWRKSYVKCAKRTQRESEQKKVIARAYVMTKSFIYFFSISRLFISPIGDDGSAWLVVEWALTLEDKNLFIFHLFRYCARSVNSTDDNVSFDEFVFYPAGSFSFDLLCILCFQQE